MISGGIKEADLKKLGKRNYLLLAFNFLADAK